MDNERRIDTEQIQSQTESQKKETGKSLRIRPLAILRSLAPYFVALLAVVVVFRVAFMLNYVPSASMYPTITPGDILVSSRFDAKMIDRYDIVVFKSVTDEDTYFIKRVIGLPGETITIEGGKVYADGVELDSSFVWDTPDGSGDGIYEVPEDSYFVLGDNRNGSWDSRYWGSVPVENMVAKAKVVLYPFDRFGNFL